MTVTGKDICSWALLSVEDEAIPASEPDDPDSFVGVEPRVQACKSMFSLKRDALLERFPWRFAARNWYCDYADQVIDIVAATNADPIEITATGHTFPDYKYVYIDEMEGMTELNGETLRIANVDLTAGTFELEGIDGAAYGVYTTGGTVRLRPPFKFEYEFILPSDFLSDIGLYDSENSYEILEGCLQIDESEINLQYISKITDVSKFNPMFTEALVNFMAMDLAKRVADSRKWADFAMKHFNDVIYRAGQKNAFLGKANQSRPNTEWQSVGRW